MYNESGQFIYKHSVSQKEVFNRIFGAMLRDFLVQNGPNSTKCAKSGPKNKSPNNALKFHLKLFWDKEYPLVFFL